MREKTTWKFILRFMVFAAMLAAPATVQAATAMPDDYVAYWGFNGSAADRTGTYDGTLAGDASYVDGVRGQAVSLNGTDQSVSLPLDVRDITDPTANPVTVTFWWQPSQVESTTFTETLIGGFWYHWMITAPENVPTVSIYNSAGDLFSIASDTAVPVGEWAYIAAVFNTDQTITLYVDGEEKATGSWSGAFTRAASSFSIGTRGSDSVAGLYDEVMIYQRALTAEEIQSIQQAQTAPNNAPVLAAVEDNRLSEGESIAFQLSATDADNERITYVAENLPEGAMLDPVTGEFSWTPWYDQCGQYEITFGATDFCDTATQTATITVTNVPSGDVNEDQHVNVLDLIAVRNALNTTGNFKADLNEDGKINIIDLIAVRNELGKSIDIVPPAAVSNLLTQFSPDTETVQLSWTAPGNDGMEGLAASYDIRYSEEPLISETVWETATQIDSEPTPAEPGTLQTLELDTADMTAPMMYFAMKTSDDTGNVSDLSNSATMVRQSDQEWSNFQPSSDSRIIYVSSSTGNDSWDGMAPKWDGTSGPKKTIGAALMMVRNGFPDWVLLKRGDVWYESLGSWGASGRSVNEPMLVSGYGDSTDRPLLKCGSNFGITSRNAASNIAIVGIDFYAHTRDPNSTEFTGSGGSCGANFQDRGSNILIEDCVFRYFTNGMNFMGLPEPQKLKNITVRGCRILNSYSTNAHSQGIYAWHTDGLVLENNIIDHNGWNERVAGAGQTIFNHNIYLSGINYNVRVEGNLISRASSHGLQCRPGGDVINNVFYQNAIHLSYGLVNGAQAFPGGVSGTVSGNVFLSYKGIDGVERGWAMEISNLKPGAGTTFKDNIIAHAFATNATDAVIIGSSDRATNAGETVGVNDLIFENNIIYRWRACMRIGGDLRPGASGTYAYNNVIFRNNDFQMPLTHIINNGPGATPEAGWSNNRYFADLPASQWFSLGGAGLSFDEWKARVEANGSAVQANYPDPNRSVASYNASIGGQNSFDDFIRKMTIRSKLNFNPAYTIEAARNYIRQGFGK